MKLPDFTAQAALQETSGRYHMLYTADTSSGQVVPAVPCCEDCESSCMQCHEGAREYCRWCYACLRWCVQCGWW
jgi:hypothetical protein